MKIRIKHGFSKVLQKVEPLQMDTIKERTSSLKKYAQLETAAGGWKVIGIYHTKTKFTAAHEYWLISSFGAKNNCYVNISFLLRKKDHSET